MNIFVDRKEELESLRSAFRREGAALYVLYGRRRLGKTTLLRRSFHDVRGVYHMADRSSEKDAIRLLARSMALALREPMLESSDFSDWYALFAAYDRVRPKGKTYLILDEFQYLCEVQPAFSSMIQKWWDEHWSRQNIMLVLCGSVMSMMYRETLSRSSPLFGRRTAQWLLRPLRFKDVSLFFKGLSPRQIIEMWALTGGVPRYAELCRGMSGLSEALGKLVLKKDGPLYSEATFLLQDEVTVSNTYWSLLHAIGSGVSRISEIAGRLGLPANQLTRYLSALRDLGLIAREVPVTEKNPAKSKRGLYRVSDPFLRLWFGCVAPFESMVEFGESREVKKLMKDRLQSHVAYCFEGVCREYVEDHGAEYDVARVGRYWDRRTELDVVGVNEASMPVLAGECKWSSRPMGPDVLEKLRAKVFSLWPDRIEDIQLFLFSPAGFSKSLRQIATQEKISLIDARDLVRA